MDKKQLPTLSSELDVLDKVIEFARQQGFEKINLQAKSFGALVAMRYFQEKVLIDPDKFQLVVFGLPFKSDFDIQFVNKFEIKTLIIQGENDHFGTPQEIKEHFKLSKKLEVMSVENVGHSFNKDPEIIQNITLQASRWLQG